MSETIGLMDTPPVNGHAQSDELSPPPPPDAGGGLFELDASEKIRIDAMLDPLITIEARRRFPGVARPVVVSILIAEAAAEAGPRWANDRKHLTDLAKGYDPPRKETSEVRMLAGTKAVIAKVCAQQYHGAPGMEGLTASLLLSYGLTRSEKKRPVVDPAYAAVLALLTAKR